jgi:hypothetical protein
MMKSLAIILGFLCLLTTNLLFSQSVSTKSYSLKRMGDFTAEKMDENTIILDSQTGKRIDFNTYLEVRERQPRLKLKKNINEYGEVASYVLDTLQNEFTFKHDTSLRQKRGQPLLPFVMKSQTGRKIKSEDLMDKIIVLNFQFEIIEPLLNMQSMSEFEQIVNDSALRDKLFPVIVTTSSEEETTKFLESNNIKSFTVPDGTNFLERYHIYMSSTYVIVNKNNVLERYLDENVISIYDRDHHFVRNINNTVSDNLKKVLIELVNL